MRLVTYSKDGSIYCGLLDDGDVIECTIESFGTLKNTLGNKPAEFYEPLLK